MPTVWIPALHRDLTGGQERLSLPGETVGQLVENLEARFPGFRDRLCEGRRLKPGIVVVVDGEACRRGLRCPLAEESEVHFLPAVSGGV